MSQWDIAKQIKFLRYKEFFEKISNYESFAENYIYITNKNAEKIKFRHNVIQKKINDTIADLKERGKPARIIILKARQEGCSTNEQGRMLYNCITNKNRTGLIVAHEIPATNKIFAKAKFMFDNLPENLKPLKKACNTKELIFDKPLDYKGEQKGLNSKITVAVAGSTGIGRSDTINYAHLSEFAFWPCPEGKSKKHQLSGILQAVPKHADTEVVIESTANGYDEFKQLWDEAVAGKNDWTPLFFAWHDMPEYQMPISDEERHLYEDNYTDYEQEMVQLYNLKPEQIKWYRWTLKNDCNNDINMMRQENPSSPEEAFISTGDPVFDNEKIQKRIEVLRRMDENHERKIHIGYFNFEWNNYQHKDFIMAKSIDFKFAKPNYIYIYEKPKAGYKYVIGADTKGEGKDKYTATVINNVTGNRCATLYMDVNNSKPFTWQLYCLGRYYNDAIIAVEINFNTAPIEELERLTYSRLYQRRIYDDFTGKYQNKYGWKTDGNTRPLIIDKQVSLMSENMGLFNHIPFLQECLTFVYDKNRRPDAMPSAHDDLLFSDMIAQEIRGQQSREFENEKYDRIDDDEDEDDFRGGGYFD